MSQDSKDLWWILFIIGIGFMLLPGCALKMGRKYKLETSTSKIVCTPCMDVGERGKGFGFIWYRE